LYAYLASYIEHITDNLLLQNGRCHLFYCSDFNAILYCGVIYDRGRSQMV